MRNLLRFVPLLTFTACAGTAETDDSDAATDSDTDVAEEEGCTALTSGDWTGSGAALGMPMGVELEMDAESCTFELNNWSMEMGSLPDSGTVDGDQVTLGGDAYWETCAGTADSEEGFSGVCSDDGAAFSFELD
jgi:hypothetical protein